MGKTQDKKVKKFKTTPSPTYKATTQQANNIDFTSTNPFDMLKYTTPAKTELNLKQPSNETQEMEYQQTSDIPPQPNTPNLL